MFLIRKRPSSLRALAAALIAAAAAASTSAHAQVSPQLRAEALSLMQVCRGDYDRLCGDVQPGGGRILACLQNHMDALSRDCRQAMPRAEAIKTGAVAAGVLPR